MGLIRDFAARIRVLAPLGHRDYALLWSGQTVSLLGDQVYATVLPFLVLAIGGTVPQLGVALAFFSVPQLAFLMVGGVVVDRVPRRLAILLTDAIQAITLGAAVWLLLAGDLSLSHVYALSAVFGACSAFAMPAATSLIPEVVSGERLVAANALNSLSKDLGGIIGPLIGGTLAASGSISFALGTDAASFMVSGVCMLAMGVPRAGRSRKGEAATARPGYWSELREGFRVVAASQWLWVTILIFSVGNVFFGGSLRVALPLLAERTLGGPEVFGWVLSSIAAGSILAALAVSSLERIPRRGLVAYAGVAASGAALMLLPAARNGWEAVPAGLLLGASGAAFEMVWQTTLQELVPGEALGRVVSIDMLGSFGLLPVGYLLMGALVAGTGPAGALLLSGAGTLVLALIGLSLRSVRDLR